MIEVLTGSPRMVHNAYLDLLIATKCGPCSDGESWVAVLRDDMIIIAVSSGFPGDNEFIVAAVRNGQIVTPLPGALVQLARMMPTVHASAPDLTPEMQKALRVVHRHLKAGV